MGISDKDSTIVAMNTIEYRAIEAGFALPSVLFLITILSFMSLAIISTKYFRDKVSLHNIAQVKSHMASTNGIAWSIAHQSISIKHQYDDQSTSETEMIPWGFYKLAISIGSFRNISTVYCALVGEKPQGRKKALIYTNQEHQLIFSGNAQIIGDVDVGPYGVSIGTLPDYPSPRKIPVQGSITRRSGSASVISFHEVKRQLGQFDQQIKSGIEHSSSNIPAGNGSIDVSVMDTNAIREVHVMGDAVISGELNRRGIPLQIIVHGEVSFSSVKRTALSGQVQILASGKITVPATLLLENTVVYSQEAIEVQSGARINAQLFSPQITVNKNVTLRYPSVLFASHSTNESTVPRMIFINEESQIHGFVAMNENSAVLNAPELIVIRPTAKVIGFVCTDEALTMEGIVYGTVIVKELYFYQSPTKYWGWLKEGLIDPTGLPECFLLPVGYHQGTSEWEVLEWL